MKKLFVFLLLIILALSACYWQSVPQTGSITIVITGLDELWWSDYVYMQGDIVYYNAWYQSLQDNNIGHKPPISPEWWKEFDNK